jgi:hypothetical protein
MLPKRDSREPLGAWAPGNYWHTCVKCLEKFVGDKHAHLCADCAYPATPKERP